MDPITCAKTVFIIGVTTARIIFPGIPAVDENTDTKDAQPTPSSMSVNIELYGTAKTDSNSIANVTIPNSLKRGSSIAMKIDNTPTDTSTAQLPSDHYITAQKYYWGSADKIAADQPAISQTENSNVGIYDKGQIISQKLPTGSYAYWPAENKDKLPEGAAANGTYTLSTNFAGNATVTLDSEQSGLGTFEMKDLGSDVNFNKPIKLEWKQIPNAKAYFVSAIGGTDKLFVSWTSSEKPGPYVDFETTPITTEQLNKYINDKILLPADARSCTIPAEVFKGTDGAMIMIMAIGKDSIQTKDDVETRVVVRSIANISLCRVE